MNKIRNAEQELCFVKNFQKNKINICDLTWNRAFEYFLFSDEIVLFLVDGDEKFAGILTLGDFINHGQNLAEAVNINCHYISYDDWDKMYLASCDIYEKYEIKSSIPVINASQKLVGYIVNRKIISAKERAAVQKLDDFLAWIERIKKSCYLSKEIDDFQEIIKDTDIYVFPCDAYMQVADALGIETEITFLSEQSYINMLKDMMRKKESPAVKDKLCLFFDFGTGNRRFLHRMMGIYSIYDLNRFITEFTKLTENEEFSRLLRITQDSEYRLKDYIEDNEIRNIGFASNRLLTNYLYRYMSENNIPIFFQMNLPISYMNGSCKVNGVRIPTVNFTFYKCDSIGQQFKMNHDFFDKEVSVFYVMSAVHAKVTSGERKRIEKRIYLERAIEEDDNEALKVLYADRCKNLTLMEYAKVIHDLQPLSVRRRFENDIIVNCDKSSPYINIENGIRRTCYQPKEYHNTIYITGPCFALCHYVQDSDTIPSLLANRLKKDGYAYRIVNLGMMAAFNAEEIVRLLSFRDGDIVIHLLGGPVTVREKDIFDTSSAFDSITDREDMFLDWPAHCGKKGNTVYADAIYQRIKGSLKRNAMVPTIPDNIYDVFKKNTKDLFLYEFDKYLELLRKEKEKIPQGRTSIGAIVMNCNPFTIGHQHLVEYALRNCDYLFIFVVQEEMSYFKFDDRFTIAQGNCKKYGNVAVIPSGKILATQITIPEYFMREEKDRKNVNSELKMNGVMDHRIFASYIVPELGIKKRFVAEEPLDKLTRQYNEDMKKVLPMFGIEVDEIPRKTLKSGEVISASKVRKMYRNGEFEQMKEMLPEYTYNYLIKISPQYLGKGKMEDAVHENM